ncbi:Mavicyanin [Hordeum vulgare]|nr:Mavicyanin [Hordeum vulgare]
MAAMKIIALLAAVLGTASAVTHRVGEPGGAWDLATDYGGWASSRKFHPGDELIFKHERGAHNVLEVTKPGYDSCNATGPHHRLGIRLLHLRRPSRRRHPLLHLRLSWPLHHRRHEAQGRHRAGLPLVVARPGHASALLRRRLSEGHSRIWPCPPAGGRPHGLKFMYSSLADSESNPWIDEGMVHKCVNLKYKIR